MLSNNIMWFTDENYNNILIHHVTILSCVYVICVVTSTFKLLVYFSYMIAQCSESTTENESMNYTE